MAHRPATETAHAKAIEELEHSVARDLTTSLSVAQLAQPAGYSRRQLDRLTDAGGVRRMRSDARMDEAARLLLTTTHRVQDVASRVGISRAHIARAFAARFAVTPHEVRGEIGPTVRQLRLFRDKPLPQTNQLARARALERWHELWTRAQSARRRVREATYLADQLDVVIQTCAPPPTEPAPLRAAQVSAQRSFADASELGADSKAQRGGD